jgi:glutamine amidotransferase
MIAVIDYGLGNLLSVTKALEALAGKKEVFVTRRGEDLAAADHIVLPGVGNFRSGMENLKRSGLVGAMEKAVLEKEIPFLGICLGMQLLADSGEEFGEHEGLGWIPGRVRQLDAGSHPLPHLGWNDITVEGPSRLFSGAESGKDFYFVHSFVFDCEDRFAKAHAVYGQRFTAAVQRGHICGTQFHPEKSREQGLNILRNFLKGGGECSRSEWFLSSF